MSDEHMASLAQRGKNVLEHYGKKGMRWGVTTKQPSSSSTSREGKAKAIAKDLSKADVDEAKPKTKYNAVGITVGVGYLAARMIIRNHGMDGIEDFFHDATHNISPESRAMAEQMRRESHGQIKEDRDGGLFNPKAQLDRSRVIDLNSDPADWSYPDGVNPYPM